MIGWFVVAALLGAAVVLTISIYYLTHSSLKNAILDNIPEADMAVINEVIHNTDSVTAPRVLKLSVRDRYGNHLKDVAISAQKSDYFYRNERIKMK